jgi:alkanesulfonate monooxygenase SsuD/methylene tetrahydromethanopterin reductase-like flavin-dependent oxidoreductase (luciferase family)
MKVGMSVFMQNTNNRWSDYEVYRNDVKLADLAEPLGFDSIWSVEHHFTPYTMVPDVVQFLTYMAGRTNKIELGTMVIVLPWHDPVRVAEQIAMLDLLSNGRIIIGFGRGAATVEYNGFRVPMEESRERFVEAAEVVVKALANERFAHQGKFFQIPEMSIRPRPFSHPERRLYGAAVSPDTAERMAKLGLGVLIAIPLYGWDAQAEDVKRHEQILRKQGHEPVPPISSSFVFCAETEKEAREGARQYMGGYWGSADAHYHFSDGHLKAVKGYEHYGVIADNAKTTTPEQGVDGFVSLQVAGTPDQCLEQIHTMQDKVGLNHFIAVFSYGGMPHDTAERNLRLFAAEVMPKLQREERKVVPVGASSAASQVQAK